MSLQPRNGGQLRPRGESLADLLERVLDKGIVVAGDIVVGIADVELLTLKVRLLVCSVDTAERMGIDWWKYDPFLTRGAERGEQGRLRQQQKVQKIESLLNDGASKTEGSLGH
jgi:Gas vesicle protein